MAPAHRRLAAALVASLALAACGKNQRTASDTTTASGSIGPTTTAAPMQVADVDLGRAVGADKQVTDKTDQFKPSDTIYASVHTTGTGTGKLTARWTYQDGRVVDERSESVAPSGDARTEFHIAKPSGWPAGKYTLHVLLDGKQVQTKDFEVAK